MYPSLDSSVFTVVHPLGQEQSVHYLVWGGGVRNSPRGLMVAIAFLLQDLTWCLACYHLEKEDIPSSGVHRPLPRTALRHVEDSN